MLSGRLAMRAAEGRPIRVGIIGAGKFGSALVAQISRMEGMKVSAVADLNLERARAAFASAEFNAERVAVVDSAGNMERALARGEPVATEDGLLIATNGSLDVVVEATGLAEVGARMAYETINAGNHLVMVNVEADVTVGAILRRLAHSAGVVYTLVDGDQPGVVINMVDWAQALGFEIIAAGRGTIFYRDDRTGTPETVLERFGFDEEMVERRHINLKMYNSFRDGTKAQIEMTAVANAVGLVPDVRGMHEPSVDIPDIPRSFSLRKEGGLLSRHGVVELANSVASNGQDLLPFPLKMGVFVVIQTDHPHIKEDLASYYLYPGGDGKFLLYRPYHLVAVEAPISIATAVLDGCQPGFPLTEPSAEVITVAKRDLKRGESLDGPGGYTVCGLCEKAETARTQNLLPLGLADGAILRQDVSEGAALSYDMVELNSESFLASLRRQQDTVAYASATQR